MSTGHIFSIFENYRGNATKKLILLTLADFANQDGVCWPSMTTIAKRANIDERTARRLIRELESEGAVATDCRFRQSNVYSIVKPAGHDGGNLPPGGTAPPEPIIKSIEIGKEGKDIGSTSTTIVNPKALELATLLHSLIAENYKRRGFSVPSSLRPGTWAKDLDLLHRLDGQSWDDIERVIRWCQADDFWSQNILSGAKLRKQMPSLLLRSAPTQKEDDDYVYPTDYGYKEETPTIEERNARARAALEALEKK